MRLIPESARTPVVKELLEHIEKLEAIIAKLKQDKSKQRDEIIRLNYRTQRLEAETNALYQVCASRSIFECST
jgi:hypothetical protein